MNKLNTSELLLMRQLVEDYKYQRSSAPALTSKQYEMASRMIWSIQIQLEQQPLLGHA